MPPRFAGCIRFHRFAAIETGVGPGIDGFDGRQRRKYPLQMTRDLHACAMIVSRKQDMRKLLLHPRKRNPIFLRIPVHELRDCGIWEISDRLTGRYALQYTF
jgi:hypothetical protein